MIACYLLVHWQHYELTEECINYLINLSGEKIIVCVDNGSTNDSAQKLFETFKKYSFVHIIFNENNDGYAKGLNFGYEFIKKNFNNIDYIVTLNNDTMIKDKNFNLNLLQSNYENEFDLIAPKIVAGEHRYLQNPLRKEARINSNLILSIIYYFNLYLLSFIPLLNKFIGKKIKNNGVTGYFVKEFNHNDFAPHVACIIFSNNWLKEQSFLFPPYTFLFGEEEILYDYYKKTIIKWSLMINWKCFISEMQQLEENLTLSVLEKFI